MTPVLTLYEDILSNDATLVLPGLPRMIFLVHGNARIAQQQLSDGQAWHGEHAVTLRAANTGAVCWRWELRWDIAQPSDRTDGSLSREKLSARLDTLPDGDLLLRGDQVTFPPGGCAYAHRHRGPGIRCLLEGGIRIDTHGRSTCYGPGGAWYETGPDVVFAQAAEDRVTRFVRVMILPRELFGKSSIQYVDTQETRPRLQQYKMFADMPIAIST